jgi:hypothetical protein
VDEVWTSGLPLPLLHHRWLLQDKYHLWLNKTVRCKMRHTTTNNFWKVIIGALLLLAAWLVGSFLATRIYPGSDLVTRMENFSAKVGGSIGVLIASLFVRRFLLHSFRLAVACLATLEVLAFLIILTVIGATGLGLEDFGYSMGWLYAITWNVVVACLVGFLIGQLWERCKANKPEHRTPDPP